jgi:hypothetical protein
MSLLAMSLQVKPVKETSYKFFDYSFESLFCAVKHLSLCNIQEDEDFAAFNLFIEYIHETIPAVKDKSTGKAHTIPSAVAISKFGKSSAQLIYEVLNRMTAICTGKN